MLRHMNLKAKRIICIYFTIFFLVIQTFWAAGVTVILPQCTRIKELDGFWKHMVYISAQSGSHFLNITKFKISSEVASTHYSPLNSSLVARHCTVRWVMNKPFWTHTGAHKYLMNTWKNTCQKVFGKQDEVVEMDTVEGSEAFIMK